MNVVSSEEIKKYIKILPPLKRKIVNQGFGENGIDLYKRLGLRGHNGIDFYALEGTEAFASFPGTVRQYTTTGYGNNVFLESDPIILPSGVTFRLNAVYGHLKNFLVEDGIRVELEDKIAITNNTGLSTGDHLHFGIRPEYFIEGIWVGDKNNGYWGYIDPARLFYDPFWESPPVDKKYGYASRRHDEYKMRWNIWLKRKLKRWPTQREINAFVYGYWSYEEVTNIPFAPIWQFFIKPEYEKRNKEFLEGKRSSIWD